jgi:ketosteroid isomerase-like protein
MIGAVLAKKQAVSALDALNHRDINKFLHNWSDNATFTFPGNVPISGEAKGKKEIETVVKKIFEQFPKMNFAVKEVFVSNIFAVGATNNIAAEWDLTQTNREGKEFHNSGVTVVRVKSGKVVSSRMYFFNGDTIKEAWGKD